MLTSVSYGKSLFSFVYLLSAIIATCMDSKAINVYEADDDRIESLLAKCIVSVDIVISSLFKQFYDFAALAIL